MAMEFPNVIAAAGAVTAATGAEIWGTGAVSARSVKGTYTLTLDEPLDATECSIQVTSRGATAGIYAVAQTTDAVKTVTCTDNAGAAADIDFDWVIVRAPNS